MLSKLTKLINKFYSNWTCTDFLQDHSVTIYNRNMMFFRLIQPASLIAVSLIRQIR